jgi:hypothetical protein
MRYFRLVELIFFSGNDASMNQRLDPADPALLRRMITS